MKKESVLNFYDSEINKYASLQEGEKQTIIKLLRDIADDFEESSMLNSHKLDKLNSRIDEYNTWRKMEREAITIYNTVKTLED